MAEKTRVRGLWVAQETDFGVDPSADGSSYEYVQADCDLPDLTVEIIESTLQNPKLAHEPPDMGSQKSSMTVRLPLKGTGTTTAAAPATAPEADLFLQHILGAVTRGQGSAVSGANASASTVVVTSSAGFRVGCMAYCTARKEWRPVTAIPEGGTSVTVSPAFGGVPTTGDLLTGNIYYPVDNGHKTLALITMFGTKYVRFLGGKAGIKLSNIGPNQRPTLDMSFEFDTYEVIEKPASLPDPVNRFPTIRSPVIKGSPFFYGAASKLVTDLELDFGVKNVYLESTYGTGTTVRHGMEVVDREPSGSFTPYYDAAYLADLVAGTTNRIAFASGDDKNGFGVCAPRAALKGHEVTDKNGVIAAKVPFGIYDNDVEDEFVLTVM